MIFEYSCSERMLWIYYEILETSGKVIWFGEFYHSCNLVAGSGTTMVFWYYLPSVLFF